MSTSNYRYKLFETENQVKFWPGFFKCWIAYSPDKSLPSGDVLGKPVRYPMDSDLDSVRFE